MLQVTEVGDRLSGALERTLARFGRVVRSVGRQRGLGDADLDELLQEVRIRLWRAQRDAEPIESLSTSYVYRTATAAALDLIRRRRSHPGMAMANGEAVAGPRGPVEDLENQELGESIRTALRAVPESRRPVVKLYLAGYSKTEIAELMGCTFDKVRNLLYRGLADLRAQLTQRGIGPRGMT